MDAQFILLTRTPSLYTSLGFWSQYHADDTIPVKYIPNHTFLKSIKALYFHNYFAKRIHLKSMDKFQAIGVATDSQEDEEEEEETTTPTRLALSARASIYWVPTRHKEKQHLASEVVMIPQEQIIQQWTVILADILQSTQPTEEQIKITFKLWPMDVRTSKVT